MIQKMAVLERTASTVFEEATQRMKDIPKFPDDESSETLTRMIESTVNDVRAPIETFHSFVAEIKNVYQPKRYLTADLTNRSAVNLKRAVTKAIPRYVERDSSCGILEMIEMCHRALREAHALTKTLCVVCDQTKILERVHLTLASYQRSESLSDDAMEALLSIAECSPYCFYTECLLPLSLEKTSTKTVPLRPIADKMARRIVSVIDDTAIAFGLNVEKVDTKAPRSSDFVALSCVRDPNASFVVDIDAFEASDDIFTFSIRHNPKANIPRGSLEVLNLSFDGLRAVGARDNFV
eukprot:g1091.t1